MGKAWYTDWELSVTGWDDGTARIDVLLPHNTPSQVSVFTTKEQMLPIANLLDKAFSELTGTKKGLTDGSGTDRLT